jgi:hypothetical protein
MFGFFYAYAGGDGDIRREFVRQESLSGEMVLPDKFDSGDGGGKSGENN